MVELRLHAVSVGQRDEQRLDGAVGDAVTLGDFGSDLAAFGCQAGHSVDPWVVRVEPAQPLSISLPSLPQHISCDGRRFGFACTGAG
jgi:hypothetical protein